MSLLIPDQRDWQDAHWHLDHEKIYAEERQNLLFPWKFSAPTGFFKQSLDLVDDMTFNYTLDNFGLEMPWDKLVQQLHSLNKTSKCKYRLLVLGRHGQGFHNVASAKYPGELWAQKYRFMTSDGVITWGPDPELTEIGIKQAQENKEFISLQLQQGMPIPSKFYVSPLRRSIDTMQIEWEGVQIPTPLVVDKLRETVGQNPCNLRLPKSTIQAKYPQLQFEEGFPEPDALHQHYSAQREQFWQQFVRTETFLQELFDNKLGNSDADEIISITSHAGTMRAILTAVGHRHFTIPKGGMIGVVIKGEDTRIDPIN